MSSSTYCFLTCIQVSQEAGQVIWYAHLFQNFPQFIVIHTVKGFGIISKAEIDIFMELSSISLHLSLRKDVLSLLVIFWNSAFKLVYLSFLLCL